jgi:dTDP-L-rhamnose 4-epimerase
MTDKILITGGAGFIGCALGAELVAKGHEVVAFDNLHPQVHTDFGRPSRLAPGVQLIPGDVTVASNWQTLFKFFRPDVVVHLAAETGTGQSVTEASRHSLVNVTGTTQMLDALAACGHVPRQFLLSSSRAVYGDGAWKDSSGKVFYPVGRTHADLERKQWNFRGPTGLEAKPLPHDAGETAPNPVSVYGATKLAQEHILGAWTRAFGSHLRILRLQNVYGLGQAPKNAYTGILTLFVRLAREGQRLDIYEDGEIIRDFVHVSDVVQAMVRALATTEGPQTLDIGCGELATIAEAAREIARLFGAPEPIVSGKYRDGDVRAASCSIAAGRKAIGYEPKVSLKQGLATLRGQQLPQQRTSG